MEQTDVNEHYQPQLKVVGAWTKAGVSSCIHVKGINKNDDLLLDCGACEPSTFSVKAVLVTHGHIDHAGCCINHARGLALTNKSPTYYVPEQIVEPLTTAWHAYEAMNEAEIPMVIQSVKKNDTGEYVPFFASPNIKVRPFRTEHRVPSNGYALYTMHKGKLLPEYAALSSEEIGKLRRSGVMVRGPDTEQLELVYTGDTLFSGLLRPENAFVFESPILIMELTYLDGKREKAIDRTHIHLEDVIENAHLFQNRQIVFVHLSQKYSASMALEILHERLPSSLSERAFVNLTSFGVTNEYLTPVNDRRWAQRKRTEAGWGWSHPSQRYHAYQQHQPPPPQSFQKPIYSTSLTRSTSAGGNESTNNYHSHNNSYQNNNNHTRNNPNSVHQYGGRGGRNTNNNNNQNNNAYRNNNHGGRGFKHQWKDSSASR